MRGHRFPPERRRTGGRSGWARCAGFAAYLHGLDASVVVPPAGLLRSGPCRATPYLYSAGEIASLLEATAGLRPALRAATYYNLIGLLAVSGMRIGEAITLDDQDLDLERAVLIVRNSKFGKSRLVPLHPTTTAALGAIPHGCETSCVPGGPARHCSCPASGLACCTPTSSSPSPVSPSAAGSLAARRRAGRGFTTSDTLSRSPACWSCYAAGEDVAAMLPRLATYLGHTDPKHTFWYLSAAPELMALAGQRLEAHLERRA